MKETALEYHKRSQQALKWGSDLSWPQSLQSKVKELNMKSNDFSKSFKPIEKQKSQIRSFLLISFLICFSCKRCNGNQMETFAYNKPPVSLIFLPMKKNPQHCAKKVCHARISLWPKLFLIIFFIISNIWHQSKLILIWNNRTQLLSLLSYERASSEQYNPFPYTVSAPGYDHAHALVMQVLWHIMFHRLRMQITLRMSAWDAIACILHVHPCFVIMRSSAMQMTDSASSLKKCLYIKANVRRLWLPFNQLK